MRGKATSSVNFQLFMCPVDTLQPQSDSALCSASRVGGELEASLESSLESLGESLEAAH